MEHVDLSRLLKAHATNLGIRLTDGQVEQFITYLSHLRIWNRSTNLTSITGEEDIIIKHFIDSLAGLSAEEINHEARVLDVGSGAGFPGIPLKIARPDLVFTLLEPVHKKASFLHFIVGLLRLEKVSIVSETLEHFVIAGGHAAQFDYVITRALRYDLVLEQAAKLLAKGGKGIIYLSKPILKSEVPPDWSVVNQFLFDLPKQGGKRVISVLMTAA